MVAFAVSAHSHPSIGGSIAASAWAVSFGMHAARALQRRNERRLQSRADRLAEEIRSLQHQRDELRRGAYR